MIEEEASKSDTPLRRNPKNQRMRRSSEIEAFKSLAEEEEVDTIVRSRFSSLKVASSKSHLHMIRTSSTSMRTSNIVMDSKKYSHDMETSFPIFDSQEKINLLVMRICNNRGGMMMRLHLIINVRKLTGEDHTRAPSTSNGP
ncbi:hypothetical protein C1H46_027188 [Malus baccata]|uniref:Uncharacterized protein n=1 Tax=Malus baccata TaxID=106549 RepID=A0A540LLD4_MALBA|nr:hypothetical protein C1H46_027188 [Malus baccata]